MGTTIDKTNNKIDFSNVGGLGFPRLTNAQRAAIASPFDGLVIFNTDASEYQVYNSGWSALGSGSATRTVVTKAVGDSPYTASVGEDVLVNASGGAVTVNLPTASGISGQSIYVKKQDSSGNTVTIDGNSSETIDGSLTLVISVQYNGFELVSDGTNWYIR